MNTGKERCRFFTFRERFTTPKELEKLDKMWHKINCSLSDSERETLNRWHGALVVSLSDMISIDPGDYRAGDVDTQKEKRLAIREIKKYLQLMPSLAK